MGLNIRQNVNMLCFAILWNLENERGKIYGCVRSEASGYFLFFDDAIKNGSISSRGVTQKLSAVNPADNQHTATHSIGSQRPSCRETRFAHSSANERRSSAMYRSPSLKMTIDQNDKRPEVQNPPQDGIARQLQTPMRPSLRSQVPCSLEPRQARGALLGGLPWHRNGRPAARSFREQHPRIE